MGSTDNFSLRWNDFESNISASFRDFRQTTEFYDVTLCCDNGTDTVQAHKVVLAACSPLFRRILNANRSQNNPFLYLKGINQRELRAVLDFMYNGEVSVAQDWLNSFLMAAEELAIKGLTSAESVNAGQTQLLDDFQDNEDDSASQPKRSGRRRGAKRTVATKKLETIEDTESMTLKRVKAEPDLLLSATADLDEHEELFEAIDENEFENTEKFDQEETPTPTKAARGGASNNTETRECLEEARFSRTKQGNALLIDKAGYCYLINRKSERKIYWKCQRKTSKSCRSNCQTEGFYITRKTAEHTHPPYPPPRNKYTEDY